jgi:hypothetical protein
MERAGGRQRPAGAVIDQLRGDAAVRAEDDEARTLGRPHKMLANPLMPAGA